MNLKKLVVDYITKVGTTEAARQFIDPRKKKAVTRITADNWKHGKAEPPIWVVQQILDIDAKQVEEFDGNLPWENERLRIGIPCVRGINGKLAKALNYLQYRHQGKVSIDIQENTLVDIARNMIAKRFMDSDAEWLLFLDDDMVPPIGDYAQMKKWGMDVPPQFGNYDIIQRLISRKKTLISGLYFDRTGQRIARYHEAINDPKEARFAYNAPYDTVKKVKGSGAGALLINRVVLEAMQLQLEDIKPKQNGMWRYFEPLPGVGEDFSFCARAEAVGHPCHVDFGCMVGHEGTKVYWNL